MTVITKTFKLPTQGNCDIIDITSRIEKAVTESKISSGTVIVFVTGSTAGITTIEYEPGLIIDFKAMWERIAPTNINYEHDKRWHDGNGFSHVRASLLGASFVVPFSNSKLSLGTWQQIVLVDFDNRPRERQIILQIVGE